MTGTEGFVLFVIALCILYIFGYFLFFQRRVQLNDDGTSVTSTDKTKLTRDFSKFIDNDKMIIDNQDAGKTTTISDATSDNPLANKNTVKRDDTPVKMIRRDVLDKTKGVLEAFIVSEKRQALDYAYPKIIEKINTSDPSNERLCNGHSQLNRWDRDTKILRRIARAMLLTMAIDIDNRRSYHAAITVFIFKFVDKFTKTHRNKRPWGDDDLAFIDTMYVLMIFMISPDTDDAHRYDCAKLILRVVTQPGYAFGQELPASNIAYTSTPYVISKLLIGSKILKNDIKQIKTSILREYSELPDNGFHHDRSFSMLGTFNTDIPNGLCAKYKYELLAVVVHDLLKIDKSLTFTSATDDLNKIVIHPTMKIGIYGISTFAIENPMLNSESVYRVPKDNYGLAVMPLSRVLRLFTKHYCFAVRGLVGGVKYTPHAELTEDGQTIPRKEFYAMQMRKPLNDQDTLIQYPDFGCITWDAKTDLPKFDIVLIQQPKSFVAMYDDTGVFYQSYVLSDPANPLSSYIVEELIVIDASRTELYLDFYIKILNMSENRDLVYYGFSPKTFLVTNSTQDTLDGDKLTIPKLGGVKTFNTKLRIKGDVLEMIETTREISADIFAYPIKLNDRVGIIKYDETDGRALVKLPTNEPQVYFTSTGLSIAHKDFSYDAITNQWLTNKRNKV